MKQLIPVIAAAFFGIVLIYYLDTEGARTESRIIGVTAQCKDGMFSTSAVSQGTCSGHGGVKRWVDRKVNGG